MISALVCALNARGVSALLMAAVVVVASRSRDRIDPEAIAAVARHPSPLCPPESRGFHFPAPDAYPLEGKPWIRSREDLIAHHTRGEDPEVVRRYSEGPDEDLIEYLAEAYVRVAARYPRGHPTSPPERPGRE